jgi:hypothetical protein
LTSQHLTDLGRAPVFYDCLVEVAADAAFMATLTTGPSQKEAHA